MLGIIFVVHTSIGGDKLVFRYPSVTRGKVSDETMMAFRQQHPIMTPSNNSRGGSGGTGGSGGGENDSKTQDQSINSKANNITDPYFIYNLSSEILTPILTPKPTLCDMPFELMIENTKFIGHPTVLSNDDDDDDDDNNNNEIYNETSDNEDNNNHNQNNNKKSTLSSSTSSRRYSNSSNSSSTKSSNNSNKKTNKNCKDRHHNRQNSINLNNDLKQPNNNTNQSSVNSKQDNIKENKDINKKENSSSSSKDKRLESSTNSTSSNSSGGSDELTLFNLVFVMSANVGELNENRDNSLKRCALKIASALKHEQERCGYISKQVHEIMLVRDGWLTEHTLDNGDEKPNHEELTNRILKASRLGQEIKQIYDSLNSDKPASLRINGWINLHLNINNPDYYSDYPMRPYHALLINQDNTTIPPSPDISPALQKLLDVAKPTKSFRDLQLETDLPLSFLYRLSSHLVYWGKAKIINMLTKNNVYVLTPPEKLNDGNEYSEKSTNSNNNNNNSKLNRNQNQQLTNYKEINVKFNQLFPDFQFQDILLRFSSPRPLAEHISKFHQSYHVTFLQIVCWLLQNNLIMQLHTYIHLMITYRQQPTTSPNTPLLYQTPHFPMTPSHLLPHEVSFFERIDDNTKSYQLFKRLVPYFRGQHHLEEIMWRENISREDLNKILKKYKSVLIQVTHEGESLNKIQDQL